MLDLFANFAQHEAKIVRGERSRYIMYPDVLDMANSSKCSGHDICVHCRTRGIECVYLPKSDNDGKRRRVQDSSDQK